MTTTLHVDLSQTLHARFGGVGFHVFPELAASPQRRQRKLYWRQLSPSFARVNHRQRSDRAELAALADYLSELKETRAEVYVTTWDPPPLDPGQPRRDYASHIADQMAYLVLERGCDHLRTYCMTNELTLVDWGVLRWDLPTFADYHCEIRRAFDERGLRIELLASDASPHASWGTLDWCRAHVDDITGVYGVHHYFNEHPPDDPGFYPWFLQQCGQFAGAARQRGKDFIIGEFGAGQNQGQLQQPGQRLDVCRYFGTPMVPMAGLQVAEGILAMINGGVYASGYWTFADMPDPVPPSNYWNQWGVLMQQGDDIVPRSIYPAIGLMARHFPGPAAVVGSTSDDPLVRIAAIRRSDGTAAVAIVNRNASTTEAEVSGIPTGLALHQYVVEPRLQRAGPADPAGLPDPVRSLTTSTVSLPLSLPPQSLTVLAEVG